jgi:feruloyl esterase
MLERIPVRRAWGVSVLGAVAAVLLIVVLGSAGGGVAGAQTQPLIAASAKLAPESPTIPAKQTCDSIRSLTSLAGLPHYPTAITQTNVVAKSPGGGAATPNPDYCDVQGVIAPQTRFDLKLPLTTWQGRYLQNGCGGYCGAVNPQNFPSCDAQLGGDFAMATDDEGHNGFQNQGLGSSGLFAFNDQKLRTEYGYESEQAMYVVARYLIDYFYGQEPNYSYYDGCSDGGREAMEMAERYPADFNGIIAGAPEIIAGPLNAEMQTWAYKVNSGPGGQAILTAAKVPELAAKVIQACGGDDGVNDGIITDPQNCHFDPASMQCPTGTDTNSCLTPAQVDVVRKLYQGPVDEHGRRLYPGGLPYGSEGGWGVFALPPASNPDGSPVLATQSLDYFGLSLPYLRYQLLQPGQLGPDPSQWQFTDAGFRSMFPVADIWDAMSTDLRAFRAHGGKLIMWQGWADNGIPPTGTVDYYDTLVSRTRGGLGGTQQFARLFMFPGVFHCGGGYTNSSFDLVLPIVQWVERGQAPDEVDATDKIDGATLTRPVYPYPDVPKYNGSGDPNSATSFHPVVAAPYAQHADYTDWVGNYLFHRPIGR